MKVEIGRYQRKGWEEVGAFVCHEADISEAFAGSAYGVKSWEAERGKETVIAKNKYKPNRASTSCTNGIPGTRNRRILLGSNEHSIEKHKGR